ncbi:hypothetical protein CDL15_Pgr024685 [Punica granatum]|uniref:Protein NO VEIN C-terminal domain-containing protein n=1 Tax=Punica granatum TaxID=22663 RepID=A0A218W5N6_PUNGR|nr:hypothetical protein CDL15_Pgr024685 [Punica granatum]
MGKLEGELPVQIGRQGERIAFKHLCEKYCRKSVKWVNEDSETGNPYDITVAAEGGIQYIEVKATRSIDKDWFFISVQEWEFAAHEGGSFSIARVFLL